MTRFRTALTAILLLLSMGAFADLHIVSEVQTAPRQKIIVEQWIGDTLGYRRQGGIAYLTNLSSKEMLLIDHDQKTVTRYVLVDPGPLGAFQFKVEPTGLTEKVGEWSTTQYRVTDGRQPNVQYLIWTTSGVPHVNNHYRKFVKRLPGGDALTLSLQSMTGFPVKIETLATSPEGIQRVTTQVVELEVKEPPRGIYDTPKGYYVD